MVNRHHETSGGKRADRRLNMVLEYGLAILGGAALGQSLFGAIGALLLAGIGAVVMFLFRRKLIDERAVRSIMHLVGTLVLAVVFLALILILLFYDASCHS